MATLPCDSLDGKRVGAIYEVATAGKALYFIEQCSRDARIFYYAGDTYLTMTLGEARLFYMRLVFGKYDRNRRAGEIAKLALKHAKVWELVLPSHQSPDKICVWRLHGQQEGKQ